MAKDKLILKLKPGDVVYREGESGAEMYVIQQGKVRLTRMTGPAESEVGVLAKGDFFGEMTLLESHPRSETATAVEPTEALRVNGLVFNKMITTNGEIAVRMIRKISARLREADDRIATLLADSEYAKAGDIPRQAAQRVVAAPKEPVLPEAALVAEDSSNAYPLGNRVTLIGRQDPVTGVVPEIDLSKEEMGKSVSRRHARIEFRDGQFFLTEEIGTLNNTAVNGAKLETGVMTPLLEGDEITVGAVKLAFRMKAG